MAKAKKQQGRGWLNALDLLPKKAKADVEWALLSLDERKRTQKDILAELNERLAAKGIKPISISAFNRRSLEKTDKRGRGRLDSLDMLGEVAEEEVIWALGQLNERRRSQQDILAELNERLVAKGIKPVSKSAFNRRAMKLAKRSAQLAERQYVYAGIAAKLTAEEVNKSDMVLGEFLKVLIDQLLDGDGLTSKNALELARAYQSTVIAQRHSAEERRKAEDNAKKTLGKAIEKVASRLPDEADKPNKKKLIEEIRQDVFGIIE